jgi:cytochrome P450
MRRPSARRRVASTPPCRGGTRVHQPEATAGASTGLGDPEFFAAEPDESLARERRCRPVRWHDDRRFWAVCSHATVQQVSSDPETFCSGRGVLMGDRERSVSANDSLLYLDPPDHGPRRKLVNRAFTPRRVAELEPRIRELCRDLLDALDPTRPVDAVDAVCAPLPLLVIAELLGLPGEDRARFRHWSDAVMAAATALDDDNALAALELLGYFEALVDARTIEPRADLLSALCSAEVDGERLQRHDVLAFCMTLLVAGNETTRSLLSGGLLALAEHPDQRAALAADPALVPRAVEEMLRWVTPIMAMARTATRPVDLGASTLKGGDYVVLVYGAANRDEEVFGPDADRFDIRRWPNPHLAFGFGEHFCVGASLARLEARVLFEEVLARWPGYVVAGPVVRAPSTLLRQIVSLPIVFAG